MIALAILLVVESFAGDYGYNVLFRTDTAEGELSSCVHVGDGEDEVEVVLDHAASLLPPDAEITDVTLWGDTCK
jgi:hypothetical protein